MATKASPCLWISSLCNDSTCRNCCSKLSVGPLVTKEKPIPTSEAMAGNKHNRALVVRKGPSFARVDAHPKTMATRQFYLILHDVSKRKNIGTLVRSAVAFGCSGIVTSVKKKSKLAMFGSQGSDRYLNFTFCEDPFEFVKQELGCKLIGVEIRPDSVSVRNAFSNLESGNVAFVLGNEGIGLHENVAAKCDSFVYIPHFGNGTESLNVAVAGSIVFHEFASRQSKPEQRVCGQKFVVEALP
ncbi:hypothetical protein BASA81_005118 [Batrachochytrium salamandrivorans]|nr:hypothetical protein BASA81_005118 [Batrachochytrium salamandrivorans]